MNLISQYIHLTAVNILKPDINPIPYSNVQELITRIIEYGLAIAGLIAVAFIVIGGFQYITSAGNEEQSKKGMKTLLNSVIGLLIILSAFAIEQTIVKNILKI